LHTPVSPTGKGTAALFPETKTRRTPIMNIQTIPLNKLIPCPANVRKTGAGVGIEELAASIAAHGLLQNLQVRPGAKGKFEVVAGGRRLKALKLLAKQKAIAKSCDIACNVLTDEDVIEIGLAENIVRLPMHPADQFEAFKAMADAGKGPEEIAARFGTTPTTVRQRLKLASVSPRLMTLYRDEELDLDQLMAFTVSEDHEEQEAAWFEQPEYNRSPSSIRRTLTAAQIGADDKRVRFVGIEAYVVAGGIVNRDLFQPEHEGYLISTTLLDRLVSENLAGIADEVRAEGWAWIEIMPDLDYGTLNRFGRAEPERRALPDHEAEELDRLTVEYDALIEEHGDDPEPEIAAQLHSRAERIDTLTNRMFAWNDTDIARTGAIIGIAHDGSVEIERGLIRPEDKPRGETLEAGDARNEEVSSPVLCGLSDRLVEDLTAHRTAALRAMLADNPTVALAATVHAMALPVFYGGSFRIGSCLDLTAHSACLRVSAEGIDQSRAAEMLDERHGAWMRRLPQEAEGLWAWLLAQPTETLVALLACCAAFTVTAVRKPHDRMDAPRLGHADQLASALGLDMAQWWQPTVASFLGRVSKGRILEAVAEGCSQGTAENLVKLKKDALAERAGQKLRDSGWLPSILRPVADIRDAGATEASETV
jgi:ParB family transcriptional regulator, chromosome partitioning protein